MGQDFFNTVLPVNEPDRTINRLVIELKPRSYQLRGFPFLSVCLATDLNPLPVTKREKFQWDQTVSA